MFLDHQIIMLDRFLKDHVSNDAKNTALITRMNCFYYIDESYFK